MTLARRVAAGRWLPVIGAVGMLAVWQVLGMAEVSPALPRLDRVLVALADILRQDRFHEAVISTGIAVSIAFPLSVVVGVTLGVLMGTIRWVEWALTPYVNLMLSLPLVSIIPVILLIFGLGRTSIMVVVIIYVLPVIIVNTVAGVQNVDIQQREMASAFCANRRMVLRRIVIPSALALVMSGVRIGAGRAIKGAIIAEQIVGLVGLGGLVQRLGGAFAVEPLFAVVLFIGLVGVLTVFLLGRLERLGTA